MERVWKLWNKVSYEIAIFGLLLLQFLTTRAYDVDAWSSAWNVLNYSMGNGSRLLVGTVYRILGGEYLADTVVYKFTCIGIILTIGVIALVFGRMIRLTVSYAPSHKNTAVLIVLLYLAAPFSVSYLWNESNIGRLDLYLLLAAMLCVLAGLLINNIYVKMLLFTVLGVVGLAIHQGFAFTYYPLVVSLICFDVFGEYKVNKRDFVLAVISGLVEVLAFFYFQFFGGLYYENADQVTEALLQKTNLNIAAEAIDLEYFKDMDYVKNTLIHSFYAEEQPFLQLAVILLLLSPVVVLYVWMWIDIFTYYKKEERKIYCGPHLYVLLTNLCFVPIFALQTDWGRWLAPLFSGQVFVFLFYLAKKDAAMYYACARMMERVKKKPVMFVLMIVWIGMLDSFGARHFQPQADALIYTFRHGFHQ